jgi:bifunctional non-homologous end joining protein LigD
VREIPVEPEEVEAEIKSSAKKNSETETESSGESDMVAGVRLTHPDKKFYAPDGTTKRDIAEYYVAVQEWMLPHVVDRPLALMRCPDGISSKCFFQRNWSETLPKALGKVDVGEGKKEEHVMISDLAGLISLPQVGVLEIHTWNCRNEDIEHPDQLVFDLDPGPGVSWKQIVEGARMLKKTLDGLKLPTFLKTSGGKGLHLTIPIRANIGWDAGKAFCKTIAGSLADQSELFVANMRKDLRGGKIYLDYNRNGRTATAVAPYSTRARAGAPVSMPIGWEELGKIESSAQFTVETAGRYLDRRKKDPWEDFEKSRVDVRKVVNK